LWVPPQPVKKEKNQIRNAAIIITNPTIHIKTDAGGTTALACKCSGNLKNFIAVKVRLIGQNKIPTHNNKIAIPLIFLLLN
jgi:hypothetical protein